MVDYISPTTSLLESNTKSQTADKDRKSQERISTMNNLTSMANSGIQEKGAINRQELSGKQAQLLQNLRDQANMALQNMSEQEAMKRQKKLLEDQAAIQRQEDYFTMTPDIVKGLKSELGMDLSESQGKEVNSKLILAMIAAKYKTDIADTNATASKLAGTGEKDLQKELDRIEVGVKANRDKLFGMSLKDLPDEVWQGGKKGDFKTLLNNVSGGKLGNISPEAESQVKIVAGYINQMKSQQERANLIHKQLGTSQVDYTGFGLGTEEKQTYKSAQEVQAAYKGGQLDRNAAKKILQEQFGLK